MTPWSLVQSPSTPPGYQAILGSRSRGRGFLADLSRAAQSVCQREDLKESRRTEVQQTVRETEERWSSALRTAEEAQRYRGVM